MGVAGRVMVKAFDSSEITLYACRMAKPPIVEDSQLEWAVKVAAKRSGAPGRRNVAMLLTLFGTAMMPGEIGGLLVSDYMAADGKPLGGGPSPKGKRKGYYDGKVRAEIAFNGRERPLFWTNRKLVAAVDDYLAERVAQGRRVWPSTGYRGLDPMSPLFLGRASEGFTYRESEKAGKVYRQYASVSQLYSKLLDQAGVQGGNAGSARRTMAVKLHRKGVDDRVIMEILGISSLSAVRKMWMGDTVRLGELVARVI